MTYDEIMLAERRDTLANLNALFEIVWNEPVYAVELDPVDK